MSPEEIARKKKLLDENCDQLAAMMEDYKNGSKEFALLSQIMGPMVEQMIALKDDLFNDLNSPTSSIPTEPSDAAEDKVNSKY